METVRVPAEDRRQVAATVNGREYRSRDGFFEMRPDHAKAHLQAAGYGAWHVPGVASKSTGFTCTGCGFATFFKTCGRCGAACVKE